MSSLNQNYKDAVIYCFSATGNTARAAELVKLKLESAGCIVELRNIDSALKPADKVPALSILAFPVYAWTLPNIVHRFIRKMPNGNGAKAAILATWGGDPASTLTEGKKLMQNMNYQVTHTGGSIFPDNWTHMINPPDKDRITEMVSVGEGQIEAFADDLLTKNSQYYQEAAFPFILPFISKAFLLLGRRVLGKTYYADSDCTGCGFCEKACPVKNIKKSSTKHPVWGLHCEECCKCINLCPTHAVNSSSYRIAAAIISFVLLVIISVLAFVNLHLTTTFNMRLLEGIVLFILCHLIWFALMVGVINPILLLLEKRLGKAMDSSYTKKFRRYRFPGFKG